MKEKIKTVYYCDHCNAKRFVKNAMVRHELICNKNQDNKRACYGCIYLTKGDFDFEYDSGHEGGALTQTKKQAFCNKKQVFLATHYQEINQKREIIYYDEVEKMPKDCKYQSFVREEEDWETIFRKQPVMGLGIDLKTLGK
jgi:hypothetical protein